LVLVSWLQIELTSFVCGGRSQGEVSSIVYIEYQHKYQPLTIKHIVYHALGPYVVGILQIVYHVLRLLHIGHCDVSSLALGYCIMSLRRRLN